MVQRGSTRSIADLPPPPPPSRGDRGHPGKRTPSQKSRKLTPSHSTKAAQRHEGLFSRWGQTCASAGSGQWELSSHPATLTTQTRELLGGGGYFIFIFHLALFARTKRTA